MHWQDTTLVASAGFWIRITNCQTYQKSKDYCSLQNNNMNHGNVLLDCCVLVLVQLKGKEMFQKQKKIQAGRRNIKIEIKFQMMALLAY
jgi:hypothetical protein